MKAVWFVVSMLSCTAALAQGVPAIPFTASAPLQLPKDVYLGEATGVAVNAKGHVYVLSRGNTSGPAYAAAAAQKAIALKDRHAFKTEMDDEAKRAMFPGKYFAQAQA